MIEGEADNNSGLAKPAQLPKMTVDQVRERAERIFKLRGPAPYGSGIQFADCNLSEDEIQIISEQVLYWQPYFVQEKKDG